MPSIISTIGYVTEENAPLYINFVAFNSRDKKNIQLIDSNCVYLLYGKFVYNTTKNYNGENCKELQVILFKN